MRGTGKLDRDAIYWHYPHYNEHPSSVPSSVIRKGSWKLIETFDPEGFELYNLERDLSESTNLGTTELAKFTELSSELNAWRTRVKAEMMSPNADFDPGALKNLKFRSGINQNPIFSL